MRKERLSVTLNLKKKWFDMILSGEKKEEYRDIKELYIGKFISHTIIKDWDDKNGIPVYNKIDTIIFLNGMKKQTPTMVVECLGISKGKGKTHWGAEPHEQYFVIKLGNIISTKNIEL